MLKDNFSDFSADMKFITKSINDANADMYRNAIAAGKVNQERDRNIARTADATEAINDKVAALASELESEKEARRKGDKRATLLAVTGLITGIIGTIAAIAQLII